MRAASGVSPGTWGPLAGGGCHGTEGRKALPRGANRCCLNNQQRNPKLWVLIRGGSGWVLSAKHWAALVLPLFYLRDSGNDPATFGAKPLPVALTLPPQIAVKTEGILCNKRKQTGSGGLFPPPNCEPGSCLRADLLVLPSSLAAPFPDNRGCCFLGTSGSCSWDRSCTGSLLWNAGNWLLLGRGRRALPSLLLLAPSQLPTSPHPLTGEKGTSRPPHADLQAWPRE